MTASPIGNRDLMRAINRSHILNVVKNHNPISRADIARRTGLSPATVTGITASLISDNLIMEQSAGVSSGGRRPILLAINPKGGCVIGIKLTEDQLVGALTDLNASVLNREVLPLRGKTVEAVVERIAEMVSALSKAGGVKKKQILGVGIGLAGVVDNANGILRQSPFFGWQLVPLRSLLQARLRLTVSIDNDVNTLTLSEKWFGVGQKINNFLTVTIGRGVGMGIVIHGQLYRGKHGGAGELGHTTVNPLGPACSCGKHGCLESYVSYAALVRAGCDAQEQGDLPGPIASVDDLLTLAKSGYPAATAIFAQAGTILGIQIANLINLYDPELVIISGEGVSSGELLFQPMRASIASHVMSGVEADTEIRIDAWGDDAWARGAASLVLGELFKSPVYPEEIASFGVEEPAS